MIKFRFLLIFMLTFSAVFSQQKNKSDFHLTGDPYFFKTPTGSNIILPTGVAENSKGHVFIINKGPNKLLEFDSDGNFLRSIADGILIAPHGLRVDKYDNIWITDLELHMVMRLNSKGQITMALGQKDTQGLFDEVRKTPLFYKPADIAFGLNDEIYVADGYGNSRIVKLDKDGNYLKAWGEKGDEEGNFNNPHNVVVDDKGLLYVADRHNNRIQIFNEEGEFLKTWTHVGTPWGLAINKQQEIYMTDGTNEKILKLNLKGDILGEYLSPGKGNGQMRAAHGIEINKNQVIYVTEVLNWRVQKFVQEKE